MHQHASWAPRQFSREHPQLSDEIFAHLDERGIDLPGSRAEVGPGDILLDELAKGRT